MNLGVLPANCKVLFFWGFFSLLVLQCSSSWQALELQASSILSDLELSIAVVLRCCTANMKKKICIEKNGHSSLLAAGSARVKVLTLSHWVPLPVSFQSRSQAAAGYLGVFGRAVKERHTALRNIFFSTIGDSSRIPKALHFFFKLDRIIGKKSQPVPSHIVTFTDSTCAIMRDASLLPGFYSNIVCDF